MMRRFLYIFMILAAVAACSDDDDFSASGNYVLTLPADTVRMDTVFSNTPSSTYSFWVHNRGDKGIRISSTRLEHGNQSGFRVNVDGVYLDNANGSIAHDFEVRKDDSIRVFVEYTLRGTGKLEPQAVSDNLCFKLESGVEQKINLAAWAWDADVTDSLIVTSDMTLASSKPYVVRRGIRVAEGVTLAVEGGTTIYFGANAGIDVYGRLVVDGTPGNEVVMRGERLDHMFDYLPYDRVSGQWKGLHFAENSTGNIISYADIHSCKDAIVCDSAAIDGDVLRLDINHSTIHNCDGYGVKALNSNIAISNTQISNTMGDCLAVYGGRCSVTYTTLAQFYPFDARRGAALRFANTYNGYDYPLTMLSCTNSIVTGYGADEMMGERDKGNEELPFEYRFANCLLRTPAVSEDKEEYKFFTDVIFESSEDEISGKQHFANVDEDNLYYDFRLNDKSPAIGKAAPLVEFADDRLGTLRSADTPSVGCYETAVPSGDDTDSNRAVSKK